MKKSKQQNHSPLWRSSKMDFEIYSQGRLITNTLHISTMSSTIHKVAWHQNLLCYLLHDNLQIPARFDRLSFKRKSKKHLTEISKGKQGGLSGTTRASFVHQPRKIILRRKLWQKENWMKVLESFLFWKEFHNNSFDLIFFEEPVPVRKMGTL